MVSNALLKSSSAVAVDFFSLRAEKQNSVNSSTASFVDLLKKTELIFKEKI